MIDKNTLAYPEVLRQSLHGFVNEIQDPERLRRLYNLAEYLWINEPSEPSFK